MEGLSSNHNQGLVLDLDKPRVRPFSVEQYPLPRAGKITKWEFDQPIAVEIGPGVGRHAIQYAQHHQNEILVAIEHTEHRFQKFHNRYLNHTGLDNLYPVHDDAIAWIAHNVPRESLSKVFILYPNPYPKAKHLNQRWYAMAFMGCLINKVIDGGMIELATNESFYADEAEQWMGEAWGLNLVSKDYLSRDHTPDFDGRTHFESKYLERGQTCFNLIWSK